MKIINKTRCPNYILDNLLSSAGKNIGVNTNITIKVTQARSRIIKGLATRISMSFNITLPSARYWRDSIDAAYSFYRIALHEFGHIKDYQSKYPLPFTYYRNKTSARQLNHDQRPQERRAYKYMNDAISKHGYPEDDILQLAIYFEKVKKIT